jgi:hypothetical protein
MLALHQINNQQQPPKDNIDKKKKEKKRMGGKTKPIKEDQQNEKVHK